MIRVTTLSLLLALAAPGFASAQGASRTAPLTAADLEGAWVLTLRPPPPGSKGPRVELFDDAGRPLRTTVFDLTAQTSGGRLTRCQLTRRGKPTSADATACRLDRGTFELRTAVSGSGQKGSVIVRLTRTASGAISGPASVRAPVLPISLKLGLVTMARSE